MSSARVRSLAGCTPISFLKNTGVTTNGFPRFRIGYSGGSAYGWGGIVCALGEPAPGT